MEPSVGAELSTRSLRSLLAQGSSLQGSLTCFPSEEPSAFIHFHHFHPTDPTVWDDNANVSLHTPKTSAALFFFRSTLMISGVDARVLATNRGGRARQTARAMAGARWRDPESQGMALHTALPP